MKKLVSLVLALVMIISCFTVSTVFASDEIKVLINGTSLTMDQAPVIVNDRTLVPLRAIFEGLGATVTWNDATKTATGVKDGKEIKISIDSTIAFVGGKLVSLDVPAQIVGSRTMVPVRFISESLGCRVDWDGATKTVIITSGATNTSGTSGAIFELNFDTVNTLEMNKDFITGAAYEASGFSVTNEIDHTSGSGKSAKMGGRKTPDHRVKFLNAFKDATIGETYIVSAYVYTKEDAKNVSLGVFGNTGTKYAYTPAESKSVNVKANEWTYIEFEYKHEDAIVEQIGVDQRPAKESPLVETIYIDDVKVVKKGGAVISDSPKVFELNFDTVNTLEMNKDFITGASYEASGFSLTNEIDHTSGSGKSAKMGGRKSPDHRVKFLNAFKNATIGETYIVSAYVYTKEDAKNVSLGVFGNTGTKYAYTPAESKSVNVKANEWTYIEFEYKHEDAIVEQIAIDQRPVKESPLVETIYIDDVKVEKKNSELTEKQTLVPVTLRAGKRPTPSSNGLGKTYDDLIFYERTFEEKVDNKKDSEAMFAMLPNNPKVMADNQDLLASRLTGKEYASVEKVAVENMPFKEALRADVTKLSPNVYDTQLVLDSLDDASFEEGDNMLVVFYLRTIAADNEFTTGQVQLVVEQEAAPNDKVLQENVKTLEGAPWKKVYLPFTAKKGFTRLCIRLGYYIQTVEFGGYQILNYGKDVKFEDLPTDTVMEEYDGRELFEKDVDWRREAWARIEQIRRGDIKVIVKDENGNVIPDADVKIDMYDHEFQWGTAVGSTVLADGTKGEKYREALSTFFNTGVAESSFKPAAYMSSPETARKKLDISKTLGLKYFRGHAFVWDRGLHKTYDAKNDKWIENTTTTEELVRLTLANDEKGIDAYIENTIKTMAETFEGKLCDWDVVNEIIVNNELKTRFGSGVLKKWFEWAQKYDETADMYINETSISGRPENGKVRQFKMILDEMVNMGVDFDGIGIQGHISIVSPKAFYDEIVQFTQYGKKMKITEFDTGLIEDKELDASFIRDVIILMYSIEEVEGFLMWGFWDGQQWRSNGPLFDRDWNLKLSGEQYLDLVYNKWWTQEDGKTASDGTYATKGYYGDYLITASKDGKTQTVDVKCYKGKDNTIEIVLK